MSSAIAAKMNSPRYSRSILRAASESMPNVDVTILTANTKNGQVAKIILPLPVNVTSNTNTAWEHADAGLAALMSQGKGNIATIKDMIGTGVGELDRKAVEMLVSGVLGDGGDKAYQKRVGALINPAKENYFRGSDFRSTQLNFMLVPLSKDDQDLYKQIIIRLQKYSVPSVPGGNTGRIMHYPASWNIRFKPGEYLPMYKESVLTSINVDYSATGRTYLHEGGGPVQINLSLNFTEVTILTQEDVLDGVSYG